MEHISKSLPVACALIERRGKVLIAQRPPHKHLGGKWEFPGGKIEPGETPSDAIIREIHEELACEFIPGFSLPPLLHHYETLSIEMTPLIGKLSARSGDPQCREHTALAWVAPAELADYELAPADYPVLAAYRNYLRVKG